jgi:hypothetical protein
MALSDRDILDPHAASLLRLHCPALRFLHVCAAALRVPALSPRNPPRNWNEDIALSKESKWVDSAKADLLS